MPSKRVSLKGKGADLFFGDYSPDPQPTSPERAEAANQALSAEVADSPAPALPPVTSDDSTVASANGQSLPPIRRSRSSSQNRTKQASTLASPQASPTSSRQSRSLASSLSTTHALPSASHHARHARSEQAEVIAVIRKIVKVPGKEVSYTRLTPEEKAQLADIVYAYKRQGQRTTENEIQRIALNYLLSDYHDRGEESVLAEVLAALLA